MRPSPSPVHMHTSQHVDQNLVGNLHWQRSALSSDSNYSWHVVRHRRFKQVRSPPKRKHSHETEIWKLPRSQSKSTHLPFFFSINQLFSVCVCVRFSLKTHTCKCVSPSYHCFPFPILTRNTGDGKDT